MGHSVYGLSPSNGKASLRFGNHNPQTQTLLLGAHGDRSNGKASTESDEQP